MPPTPDISIVIVSFNCLEPLRECLNSICRQEGASFEIVVVDNDSRDGTLDFLKTQTVKAVSPGRNLGFGAGVNLGALKAEGRFLFILNPDTVLPPGSLRGLLDFAERNPDFGLASALMLGLDGKLQVSARSIPRRRDFLFGRGSPLFRLGLTSEKEAGYISDFGAEPVRVPAISGTALFVERIFFLDLGGFDERFFMYLEDIDLCRRVTGLGRSIWILPAVKVMHQWRESTKTRPYFTSFHHHLSVHKYFRKHFPEQWLHNFLLGLALSAGFVVTSVMTLFKTRRRK